MVGVNQGENGTSRMGRRALATPSRGRRRLLVALTAAAVVLGGGGAVSARTGSDAALLSDDFTSGMGGWTTTGGRWWVNGAGRMRQGTVNTGPSQATAGSPKWSDYQVKARVQPVRLGADGSYAGISARSARTGAFARLVLVAAGRAEVQVVRGRRVSVVASAPATVTLGRWYHLRLEVRGARIHGYVEDAEVPAVSGPAAGPGSGPAAGLSATGRVGLQTNRASVAFDNVRVTPLEPEGAPPPAPAPAPSAPPPAPTSPAAPVPAPTPSTGPLAPAPPAAVPAPPTASPTTAPAAGAPAAPASANPGPASGWNPPANLSAALDKVWTHEESTYGNLYGFKNYLWDQIMAAKGNINYCVRWDSSATVTAAQRDQVQAQLQRQFQKWMDAMTENGKGWNGWPYPKVNVKVVGWATRDRNLLQWNDGSVDVYVGDMAEGAPQCAPPCGRFFHQDNNYGGCPGGPGHHYDMSLWLTDGFGGGAGGDWGQRIGREYYMGNLNADNVHILLHEMGHSYGLDDFYDWDPGVGGFIMMAGSAARITEFDTWMLRDWWRHLKSRRYGL